MYAYIIWLLAPALISALDYKQCVPECKLPVSTTLGATVTQVPTSTITSGAPSTTQATSQLTATGTPILALDGWAAGSYLQKASSNDAAILGPVPSRARFNLGDSIRLVDWISGQCASFPYLNVKTAETSYKP
ncbi:unnamed protein product [Rhizoctonia solani]|uniref:Uncharacterized protein n=1 Tax=Rhizoctonia solani TaxID=456999 RepID=A0A8H3I3Y1_9AGAM|nr:unnamed protein product [Rhizoctonia solani]